MPIALIAAVAGKNLVIGKDGDLPWHFPADLKHFKATTVNHTVLMGRKTYQSILNRLGKPLPGRRNIVLTRDRNFQDERVTVIHDLAEIPRTEETLFVIGGAEIYRQLRELARKGLGVLVASSELPELIGLCDRIVVMHRGCTIAEFAAGVSEEELRRASMGETRAA